MEEWRLRPATENDCALLFRFRNEALVRAMSFHTEEIPYEVHADFFEKLMRAEDRKQFILEVDEEPAGQLRLRQCENPLSGEYTAAEISYSIDPRFRGKGWGTFLLKHASGKAEESFPEAVLLIGSVKAENKASMKAFEKAGFQIHEAAEDKTTYIKSLQTNGEEG